jgi:cysteine protease ATG4
MGPDLGQQVMLLGKEFPSFNQEFMEAVKKILWFTYRSQFGQAIEGTPYMSDAGWGCMIRTGQMILGQTLLSLNKYSTPHVRFHSIC